MIAIHVFAAELPELRVEATNGGSIFFIKNTVGQPLTAYLIELVDYPGSAFSLWQDELLAPIAPGAEKRIQVVNMTVGAVPDYVKMRAAIYADGTSAGLPDKVKQFVERRRFTLETVRELIQRIEKGEPTANLKQWADAMPPAGKVNRNSQAAINQAAGRALVYDYAAKLESQSRATVLKTLRAYEHALALVVTDNASHF